MLFATENINATHKRFRSVITLLTLVSAINHNGHPRISERQDTYPGALEESLPPVKRMLNAVTGLLVRNHDIVATAVSDSYYKVLALQQPTSEKDNGPQADSAHESESEAHESESEAHESESEAHESESEAHTPAIVAITNPRNVDEYSFNNNYLLVEKGESHIGKDFGDWDTLLAIP